MSDRRDYCGSALMSVLYLCRLWWTSANAQFLGGIQIDRPSAFVLTFALDFFNDRSGRTLKAGPKALTSIDEVEIPPYLSDSLDPSESWYKIYGVEIRDTVCNNTAENRGLQPDRCPTVSDVQVPLTDTRALFKHCDFIVHYSPNQPSTRRYAMHYAMCWDTCRVNCLQEEEEEENDDYFHCELCL